jgi:ribonuclease HIII
MTFTAKIDLSLAAKLEADLREQGFELTKLPYTIFSAKKKGISCALYESGKLVVQGKESGPFIEFYLEPEILKEFKHSHPEAHLNLHPHIGMDESGKGDFFGPLCVAAVYADGEGVKQLHKMGVKDSKALNDASIQKIAKDIRENFPYTVVRLFPLKYNELYRKFKNLNRLLGWAHAAALSDVASKTGCKDAIVDQFADEHVMDSALAQKKLEINLVQRVRGEEDLVVAAASILARAAYLDGMKSLSEEVGVELPKGASSKVKEVAKKLGKELLEKVSKTHFKTYAEITQNL